MVEALINTDKSKVMHFRKGRRRRAEFEFKIGNNVLELTEKYKYLGAIFTDKKKKKKKNMIAI